MSISTLPFYQQLILSILPVAVTFPFTIYILRKMKFSQIMKFMVKDFEPKENICNCPRCIAEKNRKAKIKLKSFNKKDWK